MNIGLALQAAAYLTLVLAASFINGMDSASDTSTLDPQFYLNHLRQVAYLQLHGEENAVSQLEHIKLAEIAQVDVEKNNYRETYTASLHYNNQNNQTQCLDQLIITHYTNKMFKPSLVCYRSILDSKGSIRLPITNATLVQQYFELLRNWDNKNKKKH